MRKLLIGLVAFLLLTLPNSVVQAHPPILGSGTYEVLDQDFGNIRQAGGNTIIPITFTVDHTGDIVGISTVQATLIFHPNGLVTAQGVETFTEVTVGGVEGTMVQRVAAKIEPGPNGLEHGQSAIISGTGGLENIRGHETFQRLLTNPVGTYEIRYHFEP